MPDSPIGKRRDTSVAPALPMRTEADQAGRAYDAMPYKSAPFAHSRPERLATIATLLGVAPVHPAEARVLELGCGFGGNIMPLAELYPRSQFVGVDASSRQVSEGQNI